MYTAISAILLAVGLYFHTNDMSWCFIASGLFAVASAIDRLDIVVDTDEGSKKEGS